MVRFHSAWVVAMLAASVAHAALNDTLYSVTGESPTALDPETLYEIDQTTAAETLRLALGNGTAGEAIAWDWWNDVLMHASGNGAVGERYWETIDTTDPTAPFVVSSVQLTWSGVGSSIAFQDVTAIVFNPADFNFLVTDTNFNFLTVTPAGVATKLGTIAGGRLKGLAFAGNVLYGCTTQANNLRRLDATSGAQLGTSPMVITGGGTVGAIEGCNGMSVDHDGQMWIVLRATLVNGRILAKLDPSTAIATYVGDMDGGIANISFLPEPGCAGGVAVLLILLLRPALRRSVFRDR